MPVPHPKLILNVLRGTHFLQPKLVHEAYVVRIFLHPKLVPIYTCLLPSAPKWYWTHGTHSLHPKLVHEAYSQYFPPPQTGAHLYMPAPHPKLILNVLPGTHSLHPKLVHEAYVVSTFLHPKLVPIYTCLLPSAPNWYWMCFLPSPQTSTRSLCMPM